MNMNLLEREGTFDYCSTQINIADEKPFVEFTKQIKESDLADHGREDEPHITVLYGITNKSEIEKVKDICSKFKPIHIKLSKLSAFTDNPKFDVLKFDVISDELHELNKKFTDSLDYENKYDDYHPHLTVAYVKKGESDKYLKMKTPFEDHTETFYHILFSNKGSEKTKIPLGQNLKESTFVNYARTYYGL